MKRITAALAALFLLVASAPAVAEGETVFVDIDRVYRDSEVIGKILERIGAEFEDRDAELRDIGAELERGRERLQKESLTMSEEETDALRADIAKFEREFTRKRRALVEDRGLLLQERRKLINAEIDKTIQALAEEKNYALVLNPYIVLPLGGNRSLTHDVVLFAGAGADVTGEIVGRLDQGGDALVERLLNPGG